MAAVACDPSKWHRDTRDVFLIVASRLGRDREVGLEFLDDIRPFERARICSGLRDLLAMEIVEIRASRINPALPIRVAGWTEAGMWLSASDNFEAARRRSAVVPSEAIDLNHLRTHPIRRRE